MKDIYFKITLNFSNNVEIYLDVILNLSHVKFRPKSYTKTIVA